MEMSVHHFFDCEICTQPRLSLYCTGRSKGYENSENELHREPLLSTYLHAR